MPSPVHASESRRRHDLEILGSLRRIVQALDIQSRRLAATADVTLPQLLCLIAAVEEPGLVARQIADRIHVGPSTLVGVLDRLEAKQLIRRGRDPRDRRRIGIEASRLGRKLVASLPSPLGEAFDSSFGELPISQQEGLARGVALLADLVQPSSPASASRLDGPRS